MFPGERRGAESSGPTEPLIRKNSGGMTAGRCRDLDGRVRRALELDRVRGRAGDRVRPRLRGVLVGVHVDGLTDADEIRLQAAADDRDLGNAQRGTGEIRGCHQRDERKNQCGSRTLHVGGLLWQVQGTPKPMVAPCCTRDPSSLRLAMHWEFSLNALARVPVRGVERDHSSDCVWPHPKPLHPMRCAASRRTLLRRFSDTSSLGLAISGSASSARPRRAAHRRRSTNSSAPPGRRSRRRRASQLGSSQHSHRIPAFAPVPRQSRA